MLAFIPSSEFYVGRALGLRGRSAELSLESYLVREWMMNASGQDLLLLKWFRVNLVSFREIFRRSGISEVAFEECSGCTRR